MNITPKAVAELLLASDDILLLAHRSPDGDTLGSCFALYWALSEIGKRAYVRCADPFPDKYDYFLPEAMTTFPPKLIVTVDISDDQLLGGLREEYRGKIDLCIDHHQTNTDFARHRCLNSKMAATAQLVREILREMGVSISARVADCLFTGITTDTGCFRYSNTTADTHRTAAELIELGASAAEINRRMFELRTKGRVQVEKMVLGSLQYDFDGRVATVCISKDILERSGALEHELEGLSSIPRTIEGVLVGVTFSEREGGYKLSVRTGKELDASGICRRFGGGGHKRAAGCFISGDYQSACEQMHRVLGEILEGESTTK